MRVGVSFVLGLICLATISIWILWWVPRRQVRAARSRLLRETDPALAENEFRKTLAQIVGGLFVLCGFFFTWTELRQTADQAQDQLRLAESGQITERFTRAVSQLASDQMEERLGGIYSLERIAIDSVRDHWATMEVLTAFVRERSTYAERPQEVRAGATHHVWPPADLQAALSVIGRREREELRFGEPGFLRPGEFAPETGTGNRLDLAGADLHDAKLAGFNLTGADLSGTDLAGADLSGVSLKAADLRYADLRYSNLNGADLRGARLDGSMVDNARGLTQAQLDQACLSVPAVGLATGLKQPPTCSAASGS